MRRRRVAVLGIGGLFEASLLETLAVQRWYLVRYFSADNPDKAVEQVNSFNPHVVIVVRGNGDPLPEAMLSRLESGIPIVTLDSREPALSFSLTASNASTTLDRVLEILHVAAGLSSGRDSGKATSPRRTPRAKEVPHVEPSKTRDIATVERS